MCQIKFMLKTTSTIKTTEGRYRAKGATSWKNFTVNKSNPLTPDIKVKGEYDIQVRIKDSNDIWSAWAVGKIKVDQKCVA